MKRVILFLVLIGVAGLVGYRLYMQKQVSVATQSKPGGFAMPVEAKQVVVKPLNVTLNTVGTLEANESASIKAEVAGQVEKINFAEGALVKKGDELITLDNRIYAAELKQADANLKLAQRNFERAQNLSKSGIATVRSYDDAIAALRQAEATYDLAKTRMDKARIVAPFDGVVGLRKISPGDYLSVGSDIVTILDSRIIKVEFNIPEVSASQIKVGQQVELDLDAIPGRMFEGEVYAMDSRIDVNGRAIALRAAIPNSDLTLKPGYFARVYLILQRKEQAHVIPESAIVPVGNELFVYVVEDGKAKMTKIESGVRYAGEVEIVSGLVPGQMVVTAGQIKIHDGAAVSVVNAEPPAAKE